jgi:hypothetical protein
MDEKREQSLREAQELIDEKKAAILDEAQKEIYGVIVRSFQHISKNIPTNIIEESIGEAWSTIRKTK